MGSHSLFAHTLRASCQVECYARMTMAKGCRLQVYLSMDGGTTGNYVSIALQVQTTLEWVLTFRHQAQPWAGVQYVKVCC